MIVLPFALICWTMLISESSGYPSQPRQARTCTLVEVLWWWRQRQRGWQRQRRCLNRSQASPAVLSWATERYRKQQVCKRLDQRCNQWTLDSFFPVHCALTFPQSGMSVCRPHSSRCKLNSSTLSPLNPLQNEPSQCLVPELVPPLAPWSV